MFCDQPSGHLPLLHIPLPSIDISKNSVRREGRGAVEFIKAHFLPLISLTSLPSLTAREVCPGKFSRFLSTDLGVPPVLGVAGFSFDQATSPSLCDPSRMFPKVSRYHLTPRTLP